MPPSDPPGARPALWDLVAGSGLASRRRFGDADAVLPIGALEGGTSLAASAETLRGRSVLVSAARQLPAVLAILELDGIAARLVLAPPDLDPAHIPPILAEAGIDTIVSDGTGPAGTAIPGTGFVRCGLPVRPADTRPARGQDTDWLLFTSGTTGRPKMVVHSLPGLTGPLDDGLQVAPDAVWSTFYDVRRYGGLQILMRACLGGGAMVLSQAQEPVGDFLTRAGAAGVTHISGTPSHWRRALMSPAIAQLAPAYVRLSGEVADQAILNSLRQAFPRASVAHAFASTEAGVAFDVRDGLAGFPASVIGQPGAKVEMRVQDGSLRIRSGRTATRYVGDLARPVADAEGFVDTGDMVELRDGRYYFVGRREGQINVGGQKVHPEEVEAVINQHPGVRMSRVRARPSPITGALVVADVVLDDQDAAFAPLREAILERCRAALPAHKVPAMLRQVPSLAIAESGKLVRTGA
jgi:acyl-coenzyme A synthetase/AMP-(fatty) acid ligase